MALLTIAIAVAGAFMHKCLLLAGSSAVLLAAALLVDCGSNSGLKSLAVTPASADAQNSANGQVQFTAMGSSGGSSQLIAVNVLWSNVTPWTNVPGAAPTQATFLIDSNGVASCLGVVSGTFTVWAIAPVDRSLPLSAMTKDTKQITATAQFTCP
jgi:hypothetical protein